MKDNELGDEGRLEDWEDEEKRSAVAARIMEDEEGVGAGDNSVPFSILDGVEVPERKTARVSEPARQIGDAIASVTRRKEYCHRRLTAYAYALWRMTLSGSDPAGFGTVDDLMESLGEDFATYADDLDLEDAEWDEIRRLSGRYSNEEFAQAVRADFSADDFVVENSTPRSIVALVDRLLDSGQGAVVADICCGQGNFLADMASIRKDLRYRGYDSSRTNLTTARLRCAAAGALAPELVCGDAFVECSKAPRSADFVFADPPHGRILQTLQNWDDDDRRDNGAASAFIEEASQLAAQEWAWAVLGLHMLRKNGKMVITIPLGVLIGEANEDERRHFVRNGSIEAVVNLPDRLFPKVYYPMSLVVLSHGNRSVRFVDASSFGSKGRRGGGLGPEDIEAIAQALRGDSSLSVEAGCRQIAERGFVLDASAYINPTPRFRDGRPLGSAVRRIFRGWEPAGWAWHQGFEYEFFKDDDNSGRRAFYLTPANIQGGVIGSGFEFLECRRKSDGAAACPRTTRVPDGALAMVRAASKDGIWKVAVVHIPSGRQMLADANVIIIEPDPEKADAYYLKSFFESPLGRQCLNGIAAGVRSKVLGMESLRRLVVPLPPLDVQRRIGAEYRELEARLVSLREEARRIEERLGEVFGKGMADGGGSKS